VAYNIIYLIIDSFFLIDTYTMKRLIGNKPTTGLVIGDNIAIGAPKGTTAKGAFGVIFNGSILDVDTYSEQRVVIKKLHFDINTQMDEILALSGKIIDDNIIECYHIYRDSDYLYMIFNYCMSNLSIILKMPSFAERNYLILDITFQIESALKCLHSAGMIHRDIKPDNILLSWNGRNFVVKVTDFGCCSHSTVCSKKNGTPAYMPPECFLKNGGNKILPRTDFRMDYWALGVTLYLLVTRKYPFIKGNKVSRIYCEWVVWLDSLENKMGPKESLFYPTGDNPGIDIPDICLSTSIEDVLLMELMDGLLSVQPFHRWGRRNIESCRKSLYPLDETSYANMHKSLYDYIKSIY